MLKGFSSYTTSDMKIFHCDHCGHLLFFENTECVSCGHRVAYLPDLQLVGSLDPDGDDTWRSPLPQAAESGYRLCQNDKIEGICNWAVPADDDNPLCVSCRITRVIPNLADPANRSAWYRLEAAKRRLLFTLIELGLPMPNRIDDPERGLTFEFLADADPGGAPVLTGHADGVITVNIAEADDAERERRRTAMHEPYRTLLGHMRHESGHYYWDRLIAGHVGARRVPVALRRRTRRLRRVAQRRTTSAAPRPIGRSGSSARMRARTRGRTGPKRGRTIFTWSTRSRPPPRAVSR